MAKIPPLLRLRSDDFKDLTDEIKPVVEQLGYTLNPFISATRNALAQRLTWANFASVRKTVTVRSTSFPLFVSTKELPGQPDAVFVTQCFNATTRTPALAPRIAWQRKVANGVPGIEFAAMSDLTADQDYDVSLLVTGG